MVDLILRVARFLGIATIVAILWFMWPSALGGTAGYIIVSGSSMEPTFETGDLVVVRQHPRYEVADVVAFETSGGTIIHRIVGVTPEKEFLVKGDNREDVDPWRPRTDQVVGSAWLHVPGVGAWLIGATNALPRSVLLGLAGALLLNLFWKPPSRPAKRSTSRESAWSRY